MQHMILFLGQLNRLKIAFVFHRQGISQTGKAPTSQARQLDSCTVRKEMQDCLVSKPSRLFLTCPFHMGENLPCLLCGEASLLDRMQMVARRYKQQGSCFILFETDSYLVAQAGLEFTMQDRLVSNSHQFTYLNIPSEWGDHWPESACLVRLLYKTTEFKDKQSSDSKQQAVMQACLATSHSAP